MGVGYASALMMDWGKHQKGYIIFVFAPLANHENCRSGTNLCWAGRCCWVEPKERRPWLQLLGRRPLVSHDQTLFW